MAATIRSALKSLPAGPPSQRLQAAAEALRDDLEATGIFATAFLAQLDLTTGALAYTDAGHGLTLVLHADGTHEQLRGHGLPLGLELGQQRRDQHTVLAPGDTLVSFTDGLLDLYGGTQDALNRIATEAAAGSSPQEVLELIRSAAAQAEPEDDLSAIALTRPLGPFAPGPSRPS
jgi:serine phosphatase RsbU (regulator of sigma subunit)